MERLTKRVDGIAVLESWAIDKEPVSIIQRLCNRLAAYESHGLDPEEIADFMKRWELAAEIAGLCKKGGIDHLLELKKAEQDGRLVVLPCKVGDSVYIPDLDKKIPVKVRVQGISISVSGRTILHFGGYPVECAWGDGCGKDWFLTRDEAEASLAQEGGTNEDSGSL